MKRKENYVKVISTIKKYEDGRSFPIGEIVIADKKINIDAIEKENMGGFNVANYKSVLRWLLRGDTLVDVTIPDDEKIYETVSFATNHGTFRTNKMILSNPRLIDNKLALKLYEMSDLPWKSYIQVLAYISANEFKETSYRILNDKINSKNAKEALEIFDNYLERKSDPMPKTYIEILNKIKEKI